MIHYGVVRLSHPEVPDNFYVITPMIYNEGTIYLQDTNDKYPLSTLVDEDFLEYVAWRYSLELLNRVVYISDDRVYAYHSGGVVLDEILLDEYDILEELNNDYRDSL